jgi:hypothetical protein
MASRLRVFSFAQSSSLPRTWMWRGLPFFVMTNGLAPSWSSAVQSVTPSRIMRALNSSHRR